MFTLYLVCLIVGGTLVALSIFAGGDVDVDADVDVDTTAEVEADADIDGAQGEGMAAAARFLSLRNAVFFAAFFGLTGTLFTALRIGPVLTPVFAVAVGAVAAFGIHQLMETLRRNETGALQGADTLKGAPAAVIVDFDESTRGKIAVNRGGRTVQLVAGVHEGAEQRRFHAGDEVIVVDLQNGIALVAGTGFLA
jgi:hypothetical protein